MSKFLAIFLVVCAVCLGALCVSGLAFYGYINGLQQAGVDQETGLNAEYLDCQNFLSAYVSWFYESTGLLKMKSVVLDKIVVDYVKGAYDGREGQGKFINAVAQACPNLDILKEFGPVLEQLGSKREEYRQKQSKLLDKLRGYDKFRESGIVQSRVIASGLVGLPSNHLEARIGTTVKRGPKAREQMYLIVLTDSTVEAYTTGRMNPLTVPGIEEKK